MSQRVMKPPCVSLFDLPISKKADSAIVGIPFDSTQSTFVGSRFAPLIIRFVSSTLNDYSLLFKRSVSDFPISDWGDVEVIYGDFQGTMKRVHRALTIINAKRYAFLGGDHSITVMTVSYLREKIKKYVHIDADPDFEDSYRGFKYYHGCALRRVGEIIGYEKIVLVGYRATTPEELKNLENYGIEMYSTYEILEDESILKEVLQKADYLSLDMDVFDPSYAPEVGTPEPFGLPPSLFLHYIQYSKPRFVDIVELTTSRLDSITATLAAGILRELLIAMHI